MTMAAPHCSCDDSVFPSLGRPCPVHGTNGRNPLSNVIGGYGSGRPADRTATTWRDAISAAHEAVGAAEERRAAILRAANEAGVSTRQMASVLGVSAATAWRWLGNEPVERKAALDAPADLSGVEK